jgi:hypothetical protein
MAQMAMMASSLIPKSSTVFNVVFWVLIVIGIILLINKQWAWGVGMILIGGGSLFLYNYKRGSSGDSGGGFLDKIKGMFSAGGDPDEDEDFVEDTANNTDKLSVYIEIMKLLQINSDVESVNEAIMKLDDASNEIKDNYQHLDEEGKENLKKLLSIVNNTKLNELLH